MFTGIIQGQGRLTAVRQSGKERILTISALFALDELLVGESIAVNGVCLTVESGANRVFEAYASEETVNCTNLAFLRNNDLLNLERALALGDRLGGHLVSGHVDCLATVQTLGRAGRSLTVRLGFPEEYAAQLIAKGSVTLDGISLTVNKCGENFLEVNIIPETQRATTVSNWLAGTRVNMETDLVGKYVQRMLAPWRGQQNTQKPVDENFLREHGFL